MSIKLKIHPWNSLINFVIYFSICFCLLLQFKSLSAQSLRIKFIDQEFPSNNIGGFLILKKDTLTSNIINYSFIKNNQAELFIGDLLKPDSLYIVVECNNYEKKVIDLNRLRFDTQNVIYLTRDNSKYKTLNEVKIMTSSSISRKGDTTVYKLDAFKSREDLKLLDILKKLPGIEVNKYSGEIKFKGIPIESLLIDGDNLMERDYQAISRSLSLSTIDRIEGIENYSENRFLRDFEYSNKTALNIVTKKKAKSIYSEMELRNGYDARKAVARDNKINLLAIKNNQKLFAFLQNNNVGIPNMFWEGTQGKASYREFIPGSQIGISAPLINYLSPLNNLNNEGAIKISNIYRLNKSQSIRIRINGDNNTLNNIRETNLKILSTPFLYRDFQRTQAKTWAITSEGKFLMVGNDFQFETMISNNINDQQQGTYFIKSQQQNGEYDFNQKGKFWFGDIKYTKRINDKKLLLFRSRIGYYSRENDLLISPHFYPDSIGVYNNFQSIADVSKRTINSISLYHKFEKGVNEMNFYSDLSQRVLNSSTFLESLPLLRRILMVNEGNNKYLKNSISNKYSLTLDKFTIYSKFSYSQFLKVEPSMKSLLYKPEWIIGSRYRLSPSTSISLNYNHAIRGFDNEALFNNGIISGIREIYKTISSNTLEIKDGFNLIYNHQDLYNQFSFINSFNFEVSPYNRVNNVKLSTGAIELTEQLGRFPSKSLSIDGNISKFIHSIRGVIKFNYSIQSNNMVTLLDHIQTPVKINVFLNSLTFSTANNRKFNFSNEFLILQNSNRSNKFINTTWLLHNQIEIKYKVTDKLFINSVHKFFLPDFDKKKLYYFPSLNVKYLNGKINYFFDGSNLLNHKYIVHTSIDEFSSSTYRQSILPLQLLIGLSFSLGNDSN